MKKQKEVFLKIGDSALRAPDGSILQSIPIYVRVPAEDVDENTGIYKGEEPLIEATADAVKDLVRNYIERGGLTGGRKSRRKEASA